MIVELRTVSLDSASLEEKSRALRVLLFRGAIRLAQQQEIGSNPEDSNKEPVVHG
jgi:hypothetical protein